MKYQTPSSLVEACELLKLSLNTMVVAGGTDIMPKLKNKKINPELVVDVSELDELKVVEQRNGELILGAGLTPSEIINYSQSTEIPKVLVEACASMGAPAIQNLATLGGNLGTASPAGDLSTALLGLDANIEITGIEGSRVVPLTAFFEGPGQNALKRGEVIAKILIPNVSTSVFIKLGQRKALSISTVVVAGSMYIRNENDLGLRLALGAVAPTPIRAVKTEESFLKQVITDNTPMQLAEIAMSEVSPITDLRASGEYRWEMVRELAARLIKQMLNDLQLLN